MKKVVVVGAGKWGVNHVENLRDMGCLLGVVDPAAKGWCAANDLKWFDSVDSAIDAGADGFVIATPAETHCSVAQPLLEQGYDCLVEKPVALSLEAAQKLQDAADGSGARLVGGHQLMTYHPAFLALWDDFVPAVPAKMYFKRHGGQRRAVEDCLYSLAPHDIAMLLELQGNQIPDRVLAVGNREHAEVELVWGEAVAHISVSWIAKKARSISANIGKYTHYIDGDEYACVGPDDCVRMEWFTANPLRALLSDFIEREARQNVVHVATILEMASNSLYGL